MDFHLLNAVSNLEAPAGVIAVPGEAGYVLCGRLDRPESLARINRIKGVQDGMLLLGCDTKALLPYLGDIPEAATRLMNRHWPGPLVLVLDKHPDLPQAVTTEPQVAVSQPDSVLWFDLLALLPGGVLAVAPACRKGDPPARTAMEVFNAFGDDVDYVLADDAAIARHAPATVISIAADGTARVLRSGPIVLD